MGLLWLPAPSDALHAGCNLPAATTLRLHSA